jgi:hypothetical protein
MKTLYQYGEDGYDDIWDIWVAEGRPFAFDSIDEDEGGRLYHAINHANETYPQFVIVASDGPSELNTTDPGDDPDEAAGTLLSKGFEYTMPKNGTVMFHKDARGKITIWYKERPLETD